MKLNEIVNAKKSEVIRGHDGKPLRGLKKELAIKAKGDKWKFDQGQALRDKNEVHHYGNATVQKLGEEAIEALSAEDVWGENKGEAKTHISNTAYLVKQVNDKFEVSIDNGTKRKLFATLSKSDLDKSFVPVRAKQTPDAEGYTQYRDIDEVEAFKYTDDTIKVIIDGVSMIFNTGDYMIRKIDGSNFTYEVKKAKDFEAAFTTR